MSFLDRISACNRHDLSGFVPFRVAGQPVGWVRHGLAARLAARHPVLTVSGGALVLDARLPDHGARSAAMDAVVRAMERDGLVAGRRDEFYAVATHVGAPELLRIERAAVSAFGIAACGVHMTGFVRRADGLHVWVPRRSRDKSTYPGMLDNTVAGGQPAGLGIFENLIKECAEEASIPAELARRALPVGSISYCMEAPDGLKPDMQFCFDLELPADFVPRPADGEMEGFELWPVARVMETVRDTEAFKFNCNLVLIDFFLRHGLIGPDDPDHPALCAGLRKLPPRSPLAPSSRVS
jgi:isopentenyldiphosphate isomerase